MFFVSQITVSENVAINCLFSEENICHRQWKGEQTVLRFCISFRDLLDPNCLHRDKKISYRYCSSGLNSVCVRLPCYFSKGPLKRDLLDTCLTPYFGVRKFKNTSVMRVIFSLEVFKMESVFRKWKKNWENIFGFWDNIIWKCSNKLPLLRREYLSSAVNELIKSPKSLLLNLSCVYRDQ